MSTHLVAIVDCPCAPYCPLHKNHHLPHVVMVDCPHVGSATASVDLVTVSLEGELLKPNSRTEHGAFVLLKALEEIFTQE